MSATQNCAAYQAIYAKSLDIGWPEAYVADLTFHDHDTVCGGGDKTIPEGSPVAWLVRSTGTWIISPELNLDILRYCETDGGGPLGKAESSRQVHEFA